MVDTKHPDEAPCSNAGAERKAPEPCTIVIFGASGDLTARKLIPAFYHLFKDKLMPSTFRIVGFARREKTDESWRQELRTALDQFSRTKPVDEKVWKEFSANLFYCRGDLADAAAYKKLEEMLTSFGSGPLRENLLFYLATQPSQFGQVVEELHRAALLHKDGAGWQRIVVEKPFGHDLASAQTLNRELTRYANESQVCRIDHYLGKETVQNILMFRFSNSIFERLWNRESVDHVQITVSETLGVGERGGYYEEAGALRDMAQNHMLQVLSLIAMEPPVSLEAESVRDEKVKLLKSIRALTPADVLALHKKNLRIAVIGVENGYPIGNDIKKVQPFTLELLYGDQEGGQRTITRFGMVPQTDGGEPSWFPNVARHWYLDRPDPR